MKTKSKTELIYAAEPAAGPLRMQCKKCGVKPGIKCRNLSGCDLDFYHDERNRDFRLLQQVEEMMQQWNNKYGKAVAQR